MEPPCGAPHSRANNPNRTESLPLTSFADINPDQIREDCRYYTGYKPCHRYDGCPDCPEFQPRGTGILIIKLGAMGDVLRTKCLLPALKRDHPESWITWLTAAGSEPIVRDPRVDEIRTLTPGGVLALEGRRFDVLICLDKEAEALALARKIPADKKLGYAPTAHNTLTVWNGGAVYALRMGLSDDLKYRRNTLSHQQVLARMAEIEDANEGYDLTVAPTVRALARQKLYQEIGVPEGKPIVGVNTGCGPVFLTKQWTLEGYNGLCRRISESTDASVLLLGGPREVEWHRQILGGVGRLAGTRVFDSGTDNPLETFFAIVDETDVVVTADTLALHVAVALKKHVVAFFGPTCHQEIDLYGRGEKIVTDYGCSPCYLKACDVRPSCMQALSGETVAAAVLRALHSLNSKAAS